MKKNKTRSEAFLMDKEVAVDLCGAITLCWLNASLPVVLLLHGSVASSEIQWCYCYHDSDCLWWTQVRPVVDPSGGP